MLKGEIVVLLVPRYDHVDRHFSQWNEIIVYVLLLLECEHSERDLPSLYLGLVIFRPREWPNDVVIARNDTFPSRFLPQQSDRTARTRSAYHIGAIEHLAGNCHLAVCLMPSVEAVGAGEHHANLVNCRRG